MHDLLIIGGGPAGLTAGIYGSRSKLKTVILEKGAVGGMAFTTREIVNYPGFPEGIAGPELVKNMAAQAKEFGAEIIKEEIVDAELEGEIKVIKTKKGNLYKARVIVLAPGSEPRMLNIPGERQFIGCGVSYCATCDAEFFEGLNVAVVGNGDAAIEEAVFITKFASKVFIIVIHDEGVVDCNRVSAEKAFKNEKLEFIWNSVLAEIKGKDEVEAVVIKNLRTGNLSEIKVEGVFIYVGMVPKTEFLRGKVNLDERGYIITNDMMETSAEGVYAAGDVRVKYLRQVATAVGDGAVAVVAAESYLAEEEGFREKVLNADKPVALAFWDPVDEESVAAISSVEQAVAETGGRVSLVKIDMSRKKRMALRYNVKKPSTILLLKEGRVIRNLPPVLPKYWVDEI
ncbi:MAG: thioredoxin-disulfide reductase [Deltaproteobacteria bacterium]|nr:thioredoxin-disulfide reductase [Deltaproteobacteria bacterium]